MEKRFDDLSAAALLLADDELAHIAETEKLPASDTVRLIAQTLKKADIHPPAEPITIAAKKPNKRRIRLFGGLLAAVLSIVALGIGVSGWQNYNKFLMEKYFGLEGEARLTAMNPPEQETIITESGIRITPEVFLWDDCRAVALVTFESADENTPIDWMSELHKERMDWLYECSVLDADGNVLGNEEHPFTGYGSVMPMSRSLAYRKSKYCVTVEYGFLTEEGFSAEELTLQIGNDEVYGKVNVPMIVSEKLPSKLFTCERKALYLSPIGFWATGRCGEHAFSLLMRRGDGTETVVQMTHLNCQAAGRPDGERAYTVAMVYEVTDGMEFDLGDPSSYTAFVDVEGVTEVEWNGTLYTLAEEYSTEPKDEIMRFMFSDSGTDEEAPIDEEFPDEEPADEASTDEESTDEESTDEEPAE